MSRELVQLTEDRIESRALVRETVGAFGLLGTALGGLILGLALEPGFMMKLSLVFSGAALWTSALVAVWPRTRRFVARINRLACPACGEPYRVSTQEILADVGNVRPSRQRSPSGFSCYEVMCTACGVAHRFRRSGRIVSRSGWRRDRATEESARQVAESALAALDAGDFDRHWDQARMFWDGMLRDRTEWIAETAKNRGCLGRPFDRHKAPMVRWSNHPDGVAYVQYLDERDLHDCADSPFSCEDYVSFTWTTVFGGAVAGETIILGKRSDVWTVLGYAIEGVSEYVQLDGVGRLSIREPDDQGALGITG